MDEHDVGASDDVLLVLNLSDCCCLWGLRQDHYRRNRKWRPCGEKRLRSITAMVKIKHWTSPSSLKLLGQPAGMRTSRPQVQVTYIFMWNGTCGVQDITYVFSLEPHLRERVWVCQQLCSLEPSSVFIPVVIASLLTFVCHLLKKMMKGVKFLSPPLAPAVIWPWNCCNNISVCFLLHCSPISNQ